MSFADGNSTKPKHSFLAKFFHWSFILFFAYGILKQVSDINQLEDSLFLKSEIMFAVVFLFFLAFRFLYMTTTQKTSLPTSIRETKIVMARLVHRSIYVSLSSIAFSGLLIGYFFSNGFNDTIINGIIDFDT